MNEQYQFTHCMKCRATHPIGYKHEEKWFDFAIATAMCVIVIAIWGTVMVLALQGGAY